MKLKKNKITIVNTQRDTREQHDVKIVAYSSSKAKKASVCLVTKSDYEKHWPKKGK